MTMDARAGRASMTSCSSWSASHSHNHSQKRQGGLLKDQLRLVKVKKRGGDGYEIEPVPATLSFEKGIFLFMRACQLLSQSNRGVIVVGLAGPSGAGKTVFSEKVSKFKPGITVISMDNYNDGSRVVDDNYDDPRLTDYDLLLQNINDLKRGKAVDVPIYDFKLSCRTGYRRVEVPSSRIVILEGIYALSENIRPFLDLRVSVTGGVHFDLVKRVLRDINRSGQAPEDIIQQVSETVYPMYKVFIEPDLETAHIKIVNKFNPFSGLQSPAYILKSALIVDEDQIRSVLAPNCTEVTEDTYDIYLLPPGEDPDTCQSYLRMRNRDGKYSLMFEECLVDHPFIISPRIIFEVSVRLLGGLMALGYTIATILKRVSKVFSDDVLCIKIDKLELLQQKFIQVQGKDRLLVGEAGRKLGLDGSYMPHPYIEQIQLEKLTSEVMAIPDDLKTKLSISETPSQSPMRSFSWIAEVKPGVRNLYSQSWSKTNGDNGLGYSVDHIPMKARKQQLAWQQNDKKVDDVCLDSPSSLQREGYAHISEQMTGLNEKIEELLSRMGEVETKISSCLGIVQSKPQGSVTETVGSFGNGNTSTCGGGNGYSPPGHVSSSCSSVLEPPVIEEFRALARGQRHLTAQLDLLSNSLRQSNSQGKKQWWNERRGWLDTFMRESKTTDLGLITVVGITILGLGSLCGIMKIRSSSASSS